MVIINFIRDKEVGMFARAKRLAKKGSAGHADLLDKTVKCNGDSGILQDGDSSNSETEESDKSEWYPFFVLWWIMNIWMLVIGQQSICWLSWKLKSSCDLLVLPFFVKTILTKDNKYLFGYDDTIESLKLAFASLSLYLKTEKVEVHKLLFQGLRRCVWDWCS